MRLSLVAMCTVNSLACSASSEPAWSPWPCVSAIRLISLVDGAGADLLDRVERGMKARMDTKRKILEALGLKPLEPTLARIAAIKDKKALAAEFGHELRADVDALNSTNFETPVEGN